MAARAFEPFFTTKPVGQGTGLGLARSTASWSSPAAAAKLFSEPGHGTTVRLYLPRTLAGREGESIELAPGALVGGSETVLVPEDDDAVRATSMDLLTQLG